METIKAGTHGFSGACEPVPGAVPALETFSVGIFEWIPRADGKGLKKSPVKVRVSGHSLNPRAVYEAAQKIVAELDAGTYSGPKRVKVHA